MDAHADIDKNTLEDEGVLRCPGNGHMLHNFDYQQVGGQTTNNGTNKYTRKVAWGSATPRTMPSLSLASYNNSRVNLSILWMWRIIGMTNRSSTLDVMLMLINHPWKRTK